MKTNRLLKCPLLFFYAMTMNHFSIRLWCEVKSGFYVTASDDQVSDWMEKKLQCTSQSKTHSKKCAAGLTHYSLMNPGKIIISEKYAQQIDEIHRKRQQLQLALVKRKGPVLHNNAWLHIAQPMLQKLNELGWEILPHPPYSCDYQASLQLFAGKAFPKPAGGRKCFPRVHQVPRPRIFTLQEYTNLFLIAKIVLIVKVPILIKTLCWRLVIRI